MITSGVEEIFLFLKKKKKTANNEILIQNDISDCFLAFDIVAHL